MKQYFLLPFFLFYLVGCEQNPMPLFENVTTQSGVTFNNTLTYSIELNPYTYRNFYNGGGVALADINNDNLLDILFIGNMVDNALYLNRGDFMFEDITSNSGLASPGVWSTGVATADVNGDGWMDFYISKSGIPGAVNRNNSLFINNGDLTFTDKAEEYGIDDLGLSNHSVFFDYDRDGDLDLYLLNNSFNPIGGFDLTPGLRQIRDQEGGNKLYRNDGTYFTDVSAEAGIYGSKIGFGLGVSVGDLNGDLWPDIYVSNDFFERDYLYINNQDGTFSEEVELRMPSISMNSMGADIADLNHDGLPEVYVTDMLPEPDARYKTKTAFDSYDRYYQKIENGYHHQYTRNALHLNRGAGTFSEIGRLVDVEATDWSWAALMADLDQNGYTDIFVANGIYQDLTDQDYITYYSNPELFEQVIQEDQPVDILFESIPSVPVSNYVFSGDSGLIFTNKADLWGLEEPGFSNGSAYGDLDNDGDLDLVVNNVNRPAFVYKNHANELNKGNWLQVQLQGEGDNRHGVGAQLSVWANGRLYWREQLLQRGFQSSVDPRLHIGLGTAPIIDSLQVIWSDGSVSRMKQVTVNQQLIVEQSEAESDQIKLEEQVHKPLLSQTNSKLNWRHTENAFVDFDRDRLLFHMRSTEGPAGCISSNEKWIYLGGAKDQPGSIFQHSNSDWKEVFTTESLPEDTDCEFFDADGDGDDDLYVTSGGNEFSSSSDGLFDRLYVQEKERWSKSNGLNTANGFYSNGTVSASDIDGDGDIDVFVGERLKPFAVGTPVSGRILENDGAGTFADITENAAPELLNAGLFTGSDFGDLDGDGDQDLVIAGEWAPIRILLNQHQENREVTFTEHLLDQSNGWWNELILDDWDGDGNLDIIGLNHGLNSRFKASANQPATLWVSDFDRNGSTEQILNMYNGENAYPMVLRHDLVNQLPGLKKKYLKYEAYKEQTMEDIFTPEQREAALTLTANTLASMVWWGNGDGSFSKGVELPWEAQLSPMFSGALIDIDESGNRELLIGGNLHGVKPEVGRYDASYGLVLRLNTNRKIEALSATESGLHVEGQIRAILPQGEGVWVLRNNATALKFTKKE